MFIVTGGAGFIGSNLVKKLEDLFPKTEVVVADVFGTSEKWQNIVKRFNISNLIDPSELLNFLDAHASKIQAIFHLGAISSTVEKDVDLIINANIRLSLDLWNWCALHETPFIYASSAATYGDGEHGFSDDMTFENLRKLRPLNAYGWSKHFFDLQAMRLLEENKCPPQWAGLKFFNVYGPNEDHKGGQKSVIAAFTPQIQKDGKIRLFKSNDPAFKDGEQLRDFVWVEDCVNVMIWLYQNPSVSGLFNVGTGQARSFNDLAKSEFKALSKPTTIDYIDMPEALQSKYQNFTEASLTNLRKAGFSQSFTCIEEGVRLYVQNFLMNPDPYL